MTFIIVAIVLLAVGVGAAIGKLQLHRDKQNSPSELVALKALVEESQKKP